MTRPQGDHLAFGPVEEAPNLLFQDLEMVQPFFQPVQSELSQEVIDLQQILDFTSSEVMDQQFNNFKQPTGRARNSSICSNGQPTGSPESGISGCSDSAHSPHFADPLSPPEFADPVQISMQEANIFSNGLTNLLQLQEELMTSTEVESLTSQSSPLYKDTNPLLGQTRASQFPSATATAPTSFLAAPVLRTPQYGLPRPHMRQAAAHTAVSPSGSATSVIVRTSNQPNFSLPGSISLHANHVDVPQVGDKDKSSLPVMVQELEAKEEELDDLEPVKPKQEPGPDGKYLCYVCGEKAGKHSYYGGQVCASCRAFFRRSVQSKYYEIFECKKDKNCLVNAQTRKNCQFCRFKKCLESGMKTSWVLSDEERNRRFNKFNKINNMKSVSSDKSQTIKKAPPSRLSELYMAFTLEEQLQLENIQNKFKGQYCNDTWLKKLLLLNREAGINLIESAYRVKPIKYETWTWLVQSWSMAFSQNILPHFTNGYNIPSREFSQLINGTNLYVAHTFKTSLCITLPCIKKESDEVSQGVADNAGRGGCPMSKQVKELAASKHDVENLELSKMLEELNLQESTPRMPAYDDLYPEHWANNDHLESRHRELMLKIKKWPMNDKNEFDCNLVLMMMLILFFDTHANSLANSENVGKIQLKYSLLLQRYLKSRMVVEHANRKFLEAMLLLSETRELYEMNQLHSRM